MVQADVNIPTAPAATARPRGRGYFWAGIGACLLGLGLMVAQFKFKQLGTPWYCPVLATVGCYLLLVSLFQHCNVVRILALGLVTAVAGLEWYFLIELMKLPAYDGPAQPGTKVPQFASTRADGRPFTDADLHDGTRRVLTFFRGRW
jgi:hypothetical protein